MSKHWSPLLVIAALSIARPAAADEPLDGPQTLLRRAQAHERIASYDEAAESYEALARTYPGDAEAPVALKDAIALRIGLAQLDLAANDTDLFVKLYSGKHLADTAIVTVAMANTLLDHDEVAAGKKRLEAVMSLLDRSAPLDKRIHAHALLGRALAKLDDKKRAEAEFSIVRALWKEPEVAMKTLAREGADNRRIALSLTSLGEALFFFAEQKRLLAEAIPFPTYKGPGTRDDVMNHLNTRVAAWVKQKRPAIETAEQAYTKILQIQPVPPPRWVIAAGARVGQLWSRFANDFRASPLPKEWLSNRTVPDTKMTYETLRNHYYRVIDEAAEPQKRAAKGAFKTCLNYSLKYQYFDEFSETCAEWLVRHYRDEFPRIDELKPRSGLFDAYHLSADPLPEPK